MFIIYHNVGTIYFATLGTNTTRPQFTLTLHRRPDSLRRTLSALHDSMDAKQHYIELQPSRERRETELELKFPLARRPQEQERQKCTT